MEVGYRHPLVVHWNHCCRIVICYFLLVSLHIGYYLCWLGQHCLAPNPEREKNMQLIGQMIIMIQCIALNYSRIDVKNILYNTAFSYIKYKCTYSPNNHLWHSTNVISNYFSKEHSYTSFCQGLSTKNTTSIILTGKCLETFFAFIIFWYYERNPSGF